MPTDYAKLRSENIRRYGEDIGRIGPMLLAQRYDNRSHFIFELLQNAEDALRRHVAAPHNREVSFRLDPDALIFSHFGAPFSPDDVQFICGIGESTLTHANRLTDIGRFGIGFKSVYAFTDRPEIHSGDEHFAIENYVHPCRIDPITIEPGQTVFRFPLRASDTGAHAEIYAGLSGLDLSTLIFLREIERVRWQSDQSKGDYLRETQCVPAASDARKITIIGQSAESSVNEAVYLIWERPVFNTEHPEKAVGHVEVAYHLFNDRIEPVENAKLSVFFPTIVHTQFGAILQGPFRTTPSRDNIPRDDSWNNYLVDELAMLVPDSIRQLKAIGKLDAQTLQALPIHHERFSSEPLFTPVFNAVRSALKNEPLIPCTDGTHRAAPEVRLGRTAEIRLLFSPEQLGALYSSQTPLAWVSDGVTRDRTRQLRTYLNSELGIPEIEPTAILSRLQASFLEAQSTEWLPRFYEFLATQEGSWPTTNLLSKPIIRLSDGTHVPPFKDKKPLAYLPSAIGTEYPTVHSSLCTSESAFKFFKRIGLTEPDVVDDVIAHTLPRFVDKSYSPSAEEYATAIARIHTAYDTNLSDKRKRLLDDLRGTPFIYATDAGTGARRRVCPPEAYIHTDRLAGLFAGIKDVWFIDKDAGFIPNETHRKLLRACGGNEYLLPISAPSRFYPADLERMRRKSGYPGSTQEEDITDYTLRDLDKVLAHIPTLDAQAQCQRAFLLWEAIAEVETYRGKNCFSGEYCWFHYTKRKHSFPSAFVEQLRTSPWIPKADGTLGLPAEVVFETLTPAWPSNPFLLSLLSFKPRLEVELARLAGLDPALLDYVKAEGITLAELRELRKSTAAAETYPQSKPDSSHADEHEEFSTKRQGDHISGERAGKTASGVGPRAGLRSSGSSGGHESFGQSHPNPGTYRPVFHTYVAVSPDDAPADPDGLDQITRMQIEQAAIEYILDQEKSLQTTPPGNPGFDLFEGNDASKATKYIEVKARSGPWSGPVALSHTQFLKAQAEGDHYWLYVVENTKNPADIKIHRINNPAGKAQHFCFDDGWRTLSDQIPDIVG